MAPAITNGNSQIFIRDRQTNTTTLASCDNSGNQGNNYSDNPSISADGSYVAFESDADNLVPGNTNGYRDIFVATLAQPTPAITSINPNQGIQGQTLNVIINGVYFTGATAVSFGDGIAVNSFSVNSDTQLMANVSIAADATPDARNVSVTTPGGIATLTGGFTVNAALNPFMGTGSHSSSVSAPTTPVPPVTNSIIQTQSARLSASTVAPGTPVTVTADITNKSTVNGSKKITLYVNGQVETIQGVTVNSGGSSKLIFNISRSEPGDYNVYVDGVPAGIFTEEQFADPNIILYISGTLILFAFAIGVINIISNRRPRC